MTTAAVVEVSTTQLPPAPPPVKFTCTITWPGHAASFDLQTDGNQITNTFEKTQTGELTTHGVAELTRHLNAIDFAQVPTNHAGTRPPDRTFRGISDLDNTCMLNVQLETGTHIAHWTQWPPEQLEALVEFLTSELLPLSACNSTDSVTVTEPCSFVLVF